MNFTTPSTRLRALGSSLLLLLLHAPLGGCAGDDGTGSASASTGSSSGDSASSTSTSGSGSGSSGSGSSGSASASGSGSSGDASTSDGSTSDTSTTGGPLCELVDLACSTVEQYGTYDDCGEVNPWDHTAAEWTAVQECALKAAMEQRGFKAITWVMGIDSDVGYAYVGLSAESYAVAEIYYDSYNPTGSIRYCDALEVTPGCVIAPGEACLTCAGAGDAELLCGS
ncbi:MAG: hypothetical protein H6711_23030 [Myxococcales bacterium]|nr:hypothetical protein [Myxococcales bacterium]